LPTAFVSVIDRAISHDPGRRYASAGAFEAALVRALEDTAVAVEPVADPAAPHTPRKSFTSPSILMSGLLFVALIVGGLPAYRYFTQPSRRSSTSTAAPTSTPALATAAGKPTLAVLPPQNLTGQADLADWPALVQALL